jgi:hypothetical protein
VHGPNQSPLPTSLDHTLMRVDLTRQRMALIAGQQPHKALLPPPSTEAAFFFFWVFLYFYLYLCCSHVNSNCLGFILFVYVGDLLSIVLALLSLFDFLGSWIRSKLSSLSMLVFFGSWIRSKFIGVLVLLMIVSIIMSHGCQKLHSQVASTFLDLP